ncbi:MAG: LysM peptidoglycan-binding domain-containing protein [Bacteroidetes bacterium]|nr:LysM peptidoglycan-binding domain-containing protein [Bacteroidota bacterium]
MIRLITLCVFMGTLLIPKAQQKQNVLNYVERYKGVAIQEMVRCGIPASITLAQGIHESNSGNSPLASKSNNHFGIKCKADWEGKKHYHNDDEPDECFRVYEHPEASYADHSDFLVTRSRYADLFKLQINDYKGWANGLKAAGYATNPKYAPILIQLIETYHLDQFDREGILALKNKNKKTSYPAPVEPVQALAKKETPKPTEQAVTKDTVQIRFLGAVENEQPPTPTENSRTEYTVNGLRALIAHRDEDPLTIAWNYDLYYQQVVQFNDLTPDEKFKEGEFIFLQSKKSKGAEKNYTLKNGESMRDVSQKFGIRLRDLYAKNLMKAYDQIPAGETVQLQEKRKASPRTISYAQFLKSLHTQEATTTTSNPSPYNTNSQYQVQSSDTLYSIARKFNLSVEQLKALNKLDNTNIREGQTLVVAQ